MIIQRYSPEQASQWDALVQVSRNGTFLFLRGYMDYHSQRFADHSLMVFDDHHKLLALLPANEVADSQGRTLWSHQGLTYGGLILSRKMHAAQVLSAFDAIISYLRAEQFVCWHYKPVPTIYHRLPSQDDIYALFRHGAQMRVCNLSCTLQLDADPDVQVSADASRRHRYHLAQQYGLRLLQGGVDLPLSEALSRFWPIMEQNMMQRYGARPVHSLPEMQLLAQRFPHNIQCYLVTSPHDGDVAGEVLFVSHQVAHAQYGHASEVGRSLGALDFLYLSLIARFTQSSGPVRYFDFGTSNESQGQILNETLIAQKEGFGGRGVAYPCFTLQL